MCFMRHRHLIIATAWVLALSVPSAWAGSPTVSNVRATQKAQTQLVDVFYDLSATNSGPFSVSMAVSTNNGASYDLLASSFTGSGVGNAVTPGTRKQVTWDAGTDWPGQYSSTVRFKVTAADGPPKTGDYMVIDLSGGTGASSYPVTYLNAVPSGGWTDTYKTTKLVMRKIPKGTFTMGSPSGELGRYSDEPQHTVTLTKDFYMGVFEVTQRQWELVMGNKPSYFNNASYYDSRPVEQVSYFDIRENPANSVIIPNWPASSQTHANSFMGKLRAKTGLSTFDLPTESQWEYACRAGTTTALNTGYNLTSTGSDTRMDVAGRYWYNGGSGNTKNGDTSVATAKVGSYLPNAWGLYDMHANVWEWCLDWYGTYPTTVSDPLGAASGSCRVMRGGSWIDFAFDCRSANLYEYGYPDYRYFNVGFRAARTLPPEITLYNLTVNGGTGGGAYAAGTPVTVTANPASAGFFFVGWTGDFGGVVNPGDPSQTFLMPSCFVTLTANYSLLPPP